MALPFAQLSFPEIYERALVGPLFRPWAELVLDDVEVFFSGQACRGTRDASRTGTAW